MLYPIVTPFWLVLQSSSFESKIMSPSLRTNPTCNIALPLVKTEVNCHIYDSWVVRHQLVLPVHAHDTRMIYSHDMPYILPFSSHWFAITHIPCNSSLIFPCKSSIIFPYHSSIIFPYGGFHKWGAPNWMVPPFQEPPRINPRISRVMARYFAGDIDVNSIPGQVRC